MMLKRFLCFVCLGSLIMVEMSWINWLVCEIQEERNFFVMPSKGVAEIM